MVKTKREFIIATFILSCTATVLSVVSIATKEWVKGELKPLLEIKGRHLINYGLFSGSYIQYIIDIRIEMEINIACLFYKNICAFSTLVEDSDRTKELLEIVNNCTSNSQTNTAKFFELAVTPDISDEILENDAKFSYMRSTDFYILKNSLHNSEEVTNDYLQKIGDTILKRNVYGIDFPFLDNLTTNYECDETFINSGLWLSTITFLSLSILMGVITTIMSVINIAGNPISPLLNIFGLYIFNGFAAFLLLMTMILWGALFNNFILKNVALTLSLRGFYKNDIVNLGFSYWIIFASILLHLINIGLLYLRQHLIEKEPQISEEKIHSQDEDGMIYVY